MNLRTLRQIAGVAPTLYPSAPFDPARTLVLLIDYQNEYRSGPLALPDEASASAAGRRLRAWADSVGVAVIHVQHQTPPGAAVFSVGSAGAQAIDGLAARPDEATILKQQPSAFAGTGLAAELMTRDVSTLLIAGYMTHNCVDSTARDAFHRGYRVGVVADASATRDLPGPDGQPIAAASVHAAVLAGLGDRIAEIVDVAMLESLRVI